MNEEVSPFVVDDSWDRLFIDHPMYEITPQAFSLEIEKAVKELNLDYLAAATYVCEKYELEYSVVPRLLTPTMRDKIEMAAEDKKSFKKVRAN